jgi:hypothetical protein
MTPPDARDRREAPGPPGRVPRPGRPNPGLPRIPAPRLPPGGPVDSPVAGAPPGFDGDRLAVTRRALLHRRAGAAAAVWPRLAASLGPDWLGLFTASAGDRPPPGALVDGWELARALHRRGELGDAAAVELAEREVALYYDGRNPPRRRRAPALRRAGRRVLVHVAGRTLQLGAG